MAVLDVIFTAHLDFHTIKQRIYIFVELFIEILTDELFIGGDQCEVLVLVLVRDLPHHLDPDRAPAHHHNILEKL